MCDAEVVHVRQEGTRTLPLSVKTSAFHTHYNPEMENEIMCMRKNITMLLEACKT